MNDLPIITEEMVDAAARALWDVPARGVHNVVYRDQARRAIEAALRAGGFEVETSTYLPVGAQSGIDEQRLVGSWVRVSGETHE